MSRNNYLEQLKQFTLNFFTNSDIKIYLFGSQARGDSNLGSDVDLGYVAKSDVDPNLISAFRFALEESTIPFKVDIVNLDDVSDNFRKKALGESIIWKG